MRNVMGALSPGVPYLIAIILFLMALLGIRALARAEIKRAQKRDHDD